MHKELEMFALDRLQASKPLAGLVCDAVVASVMTCLVVSTQLEPMDRCHPNQTRARDGGIR